MGISGGKDSAALAIYLHKKHPELDVEYYFCDTGKELEETYALIRNLEIYLGKKVEKLNGAPESHEDPFDHFLESYGGYLPSSNARWCTKKLKLDPFEEWIGDDPCDLIRRHPRRRRQGRLHLKEAEHSVDFSISEEYLEP